MATTALVLLGMGLAGCGGGKDAPSHKDREIAAVERLLNLERKAIAEGDQSQRESRTAERQARECLTRESLVCVEAGATIIESSTRTLEDVTGRIQRIHREINGYSREAIEVAYAGAASPSTNSR